MSRFNDHPPLLGTGARLSVDPGTLDLSRRQSAAIASAAYASGLDRDRAREVVALYLDFMRNRHPDDDADA